MSYLVLNKVFQRVAVQKVLTAVNTLTSHSCRYSLDDVEERFKHCLLLNECASKKDC